MSKISFEHYFAIILTIMFLFLLVAIPFSSEKRLRNYSITADSTRYVIEGEDCIVLVKQNKVRVECNIK